MKLLWNESPRLFVVCVVLSLLQAATTIVLLMTLTRGVLVRTDNGAGWMVALALLSALAAIVAFTPRLVMRMSRGTLERVRDTLIDGVVGAPLARLERVGGTTVLASLTEDSARLSTALPASVALARDMTFLVLCFALLFWISWSAGLVAALVLVAVGVPNYVLRRKTVREERVLMRARERLLTLFRHSLDGMKEIRTRAALRDALRENIGGAEASIRSSLAEAVKYSSAAEAVTVAGLFGILALLTHGLGNDVAPQFRATAIAMVIMMMVPMRTIPGTLQSLAQGELALARVRQLAHALSTSPQTLGSSVSRTSVGTDTPRHRLTFQDVSYRYVRGNTPDFSVGPINFELQSGQVLFVVGGNGSGKTTLVKLLSGLYMPSSGSIRFNDTLVDNGSVAWFRDQSTTLFYDFCLFESLAGTAADPDMTAATRLVSDLQLDNVADPNESLLQQSLRYSSGQRRRVALLQALLVERPICILDEFAADQDPQVRDVFYDSLLTSLRTRGKIVIVVTHDSRYFDRADLVLRLDRGGPPTIGFGADSTSNRPSSAQAPREVRHENAACAPILESK